MRRSSCLQKAVALGFGRGFGQHAPQATTQVVDAANLGRSFSSESDAGDKGSSAPAAARPPRQPRRTLQRNESWTRLKAPPPPGSAPPPPPPAPEKQATHAKDRRGAAPSQQRPPAARNQQQRPPQREGFKIPPRHVQGFAASGAVPKDASRRPRNQQGPRRDGQRPPPNRRPQQARGSFRRGSEQMMPPSFANANYPTFGEVHGEKDFIAEIYTDRDETWDFKMGAPGAWEHKEIPTVTGIAADIHDTLESVKETVMGDYQKGVEAILISAQGGTKELEGAAGDGRSSSSSDDESDSSDSDSDDEKAVEAASGGEGQRLVKPGEDVELIKPKDEEMEALWKNLKDATIYNVLSHETAELQRKVKSGHSLLGAKQEEAMLVEIADKEGPEDAALRAALDKYRAVLESNASWSFADKRVVMKGLSRDLSSFS